MRSLHWFRTDLRCEDNTALQNAIKSSDELMAVFIVSLETWKLHHAAPIKVDFILKNLAILSENLTKKGISLLIKVVDNYSDSVRILKEICETYKIDAIYFNREYEFDELKRDKEVERTIRELGKEIYLFHDQTLLPPGVVLSQQDKPFKIFTHFKKGFFKKIGNSKILKPVQLSSKRFKLITNPDSIPDLKKFTLSSNKNTISWKGGEKHAEKLLVEFCEDGLMDYHIDRDFPYRNATSQLSPYLAQGVISARKCIDIVMNYLQIDFFHDIENFEGPSMWVSELIWRDFFKNILYHFPIVSRNKPFRIETENIPWKYDMDIFKAWCDGQTGFPIIDAAMRQLNQTGWMHNRLRMVVANFLTKLLLIDWRWGERYFMENLIDGDLAANNGNWQWCASTGTDCAPYFRIFNPILQSKKFDPEGQFIRKYCPELSGFDNKTIHDPQESKNLDLFFKNNSYPDKIIDLKKARQVTLTAFQNLMSDRN